MNAMVVLQMFKTIKLIKKSLEDCSFQSELVINHCLKRYGKLKNRLIITVQFVWLQIPILLNRILGNFNKLNILKVIFSINTLFSSQVAYLYQSCRQYINMKSFSLLLYKQIVKVVIATTILILFRIESQINYLYLSFTNKEKCDEQSNIFKVLQTIIFINRKHIILLLLQLCLLASSQYCNRSHAFEYSNTDCVFDYTFKDLICTDFAFLQCNWIECVHWKKVGNDTVCDQTKVFYDDSWNFCTRQCCENSVSYPYSYKSIGDCQAYLDQQHRLGVIIAGSICGGLIVIGGIWLCCKGTADKCDCDCGGDCLETCCGVLCCVCCLCLKGMKQSHSHEKHHKHGLNSVLTE